MDDRGLLVVEYQGTTIRRKWSRERNCWGYVGIDALAAMGSKDPKGSLKQMIDHDSLQELAPHYWVDTISPHGGRKARMFDKRGLSLLAMKAQTEKAAAFRGWLAELVEALDDGKVTLVPGPNSGEEIAQRVAARREVAKSVSAAHAVIDQVGGEYYHHINLEKNECRHLHGEEPKAIKKKWGVNPNKPTADLEPLVALGYRSMVGAIFVGQHQVGGVNRTNLKDKIKEIPEAVATFMVSQLGRPLLELMPQPDIAPHVKAQKKAEKRLTAPKQGGQLQLQFG